MLDICIKPHLAFYLVDCGLTVGTLAIIVMLGIFVVIGESSLTLGDVSIGALFVNNTVVAIIFSVMSRRYLLIFEKKITRLS